MNQGSETAVFRKRPFQENKYLLQDAVVSAVKTHPETFGLRVILTAWTKATDCANPCEDPKNICYFHFMERNLCSQTIDGNL